MKSFVLTLFFTTSLLWMINLTHLSSSGAQTQAQQSHSPVSHSPPQGSTSGSSSSVDGLPSIPLTLVHPPEKGIQVGDLLEFHLQSPSSGRLHVQESSNSLDEGWEIDLEKSQGDSLFVIPLRSGQTRLPSFVLLDEKGQAVGRTQSVPLEVQSVLSQEEKQAWGDAVGPIPPLGVQFPVWLMVVSVLILIGLLSALIYVWRKRKKRDLSTPVDAPVDTRTEDEVARDELTALVKQQLLEKSRYKEYYFKLSDILKKYIGSRYRFLAREATAVEILFILKNDLVLDSHVLSDLEQIFTCLDQVKFSDYIPQVHEGDQVLERVRTWVMKTQRVPQVIQNHHLEVEAKKDATL